MGWEMDGCVLVSPATAEMWVGEWWRCGCGCGCGVDGGLLRVGLGSVPWLDQGICIGDCVVRDGEKKEREGGSQWMLAVLY